jgi:hypothetical protein
MPVILSEGLASGNPMLSSSAVTTLGYPVNQEKRFWFHFGRIE